jgi:hypothetical protein
VLRPRNTITKKITLHHYLNSFGFRKSSKSKAM